MSYLACNILVQSKIQPFIFIPVYCYIILQTFHQVLRNKLKHTITERMVTDSFSPVNQTGYLCKQCRFRWDGSSRAVSSGSTLFAILLEVFDWHPPLTTMYMSKFKVIRGHLRNLGMERLNWYILKGVGICKCVIHDKSHTCIGETQTQ